MIMATLKFEPRPEVVNAAVVTEVLAEPVTAAGQEGARQVNVPPVLLDTSIWKII